MPPKPNLNAKVIEAAGGVIERPSPTGKLIAIVRRERYGLEWTLPKGKRDPGETWQENALREVLEETGITARITGTGGCTFYLAGGIPKVVVIWRMETIGDPPPFVPNEETVELAWLPPHEAASRLTYPQEADLVRTLYP